MTPTIGRIVHYVLPDNGANVYPGEHRAAIIVRTWSPTTVQLQVFLDGSNDAPLAVPIVWVTSVSQDEETKAPGTWHWPERDA